MSRGEVAESKNRKTRSDKKRDIKPTISTNLKDCIYRLSYITNTPVKVVVEVLCEKGLKSRKVIDYLSNYFRRDFKFLNTVYMGDLERESLQRKYQSGKNERISTRFKQETYEEISLLSQALDVTPSKATSLLLDASIRNTNLLNAFVKTYLHDHIDETRMKELKQVLKYINKNNPYKEEISWFTLLSMIFEDVKDSTTNIKEVIHSWIDKYRE
ncbi:hypothetical protein [Peribacillus frigoritolerans]|uniref:hypothetical protein n=1 Tax=Peribacillus frigoritolerans TaxID=450367 RepID=UPI0007BFC35B|nr:hypothetical protein [Peribacillus frigoritolerans]MCM3169477.1 hypothetical protein [Peribacillus frigoritolerans]